MLLLFACSAWPLELLFHKYKLTLYFEICNCRMAVRGRTRDVFSQTFLVSDKRIVVS